MSPLIIPLHDITIPQRLLCGNKAFCLGELSRKGLRVPPGFCLSAAAYQLFLNSENLREKLLMELGRKPPAQMRWEELWDAALRIRNLFVRARLPAALEREISAACSGVFAQSPVGVRSSSLQEDSAEHSYAGLHESYLNVHGAANIIRHIKLVWASLWSDAALSFSRELQLDAVTSAMAVIVQQMVFGEASGVCFTVNPLDPRQAVIEAVHGLNKGLVDGDISPDRWLLSRDNNRVLRHEPAERRQYAQPAAEQVQIMVLPEQLQQQPPLGDQQVAAVWELARTCEQMFGQAQDVEWTMRGEQLYVLQSRPVTAAAPSEAAPDRRSWDLSLRRSLENLQRLKVRLEEELVPRMLQQAEETGLRDMRGMDDSALAHELQERKAMLAYWQKIYWDECIPFAHGARLFGQIYNSRLAPEDPFEFMGLLAHTDLISVKRNGSLLLLADELREHPEWIDAAGQITDAAFQEKFAVFLAEFGGSTCSVAYCADERAQVLRLLKTMAATHTAGRPADHDRRQALTQRYFAAFSEPEQQFARALLELAVSSYRLRDNDNVYLGKFETLLTQAIDESRRRLSQTCTEPVMCRNLEEALHQAQEAQPAPVPRSAEADKAAVTPLSARQLRGQPAGPGLARGRARVVTAHHELFEMQAGEILVCDALDPNMTFVIPLCAGIVERRGGMLIHGAIIAREYGIACVTGITAATKFIHTGDELTVDGYFGLVIIHKKQ